MHTLLILLALSLAGLGSLVCHRLQRPAHSWADRHTLQLAGLGLPVIVLSLLGGTLVHFVSQLCFQMAAPLDVTLTTNLAGLGLAGLVGAILLNSLRVLLLPWYIYRRTWAAPAGVQTTVPRLAAEIGLRRPPPVQLILDARPRAFVTGLRRPHLLLSSGLLAILDTAELEAVLCHELLHLQRGDLWRNALAVVLHDLTFFLPPTRRLYHVLRAEQELACDDQVVGPARRLALASALARVWQHQLGVAPAARGVLALLAPRATAAVEVRLRRLLDQPGGVPPRSHRAWLVVSGVGGVVIGAQLAATLWVMTLLQCTLLQQLPLPAGWLH